MNGRIAPLEVPDAEPEGGSGEDPSALVLDDREQAALFLASDDARDATGGAQVVDAGLLTR